MDYDRCGGCGDVFTEATRLAGRVVSDDLFLCPLCVQKHRAEAAELREKHRQENAMHTTPEMNAKLGGNDGHS